MLARARVLAKPGRDPARRVGADEGQGFEVFPMGSVAYKLSQVTQVGRGDATWTASRQAR
ncbi:MAG: hypothetical protein U0166_25920 [Acidobacteriota bacterium]